MWSQIVAIAWAQFRLVRNHWPRTGAGTILMGAISTLWYGIYAALAVLLAMGLPSVPWPLLRVYLPAGLLGVFLFWQLVPLLTLSTGWSLQLNKLQVYPVRHGTLFAIETLLRLTTSPEMILVLLGGMIGLFRHPQSPLFAPLALLLYIPFNLFLSLAIREMFLQAFQRNRLREIMAILVLGLSVVPQILARTVWGRQIKGYFLLAASGIFTPWHEMASLSIGLSVLRSLLIMSLFIAAAWWFANWQFKKTLLVESDSFRRPAPIREQTAKFGFTQGLWDFPSRIFRDPMAALVQKELRSLLRIPRFRVLFGMACIFGMLIFVPNILENRQSSFASNDFLPLVNIYGLLLLGDVLFWNIFGFDRWASQLYFVAPMRIDTALKAKNAVAGIFMLIQTLIVMLVALLFRVRITGQAIANEFALTAVAALFFISMGNLSSVIVPRGVDPSQTFRKQASGKMQLWLLGSSIGVFALGGFAFLARYAFDTNWAFLGALAVEFVIGIVVYRIASESAIERAMRERERILEALSRGVAQGLT